MKQNGLEHAKNAYDAFKSETGCSDITCLRQLSSADVASSSSQVTRSVKPNPIKLSLMETFHPVVDGNHLKDQLINSFRNGGIRKHTPINWNWAKDDRNDLKYKIISW